MSDQIVWKEAKSQPRRRDRLEDQDETDGYEVAPDEATSCDEGDGAPDSQTSVEQHDDAEAASDRSQETGPEETGWQSDEDDEATKPAIYAPASSKQVQSIKGFSHSRINLNLRRNITKLADPAQHKARPDHVPGGQGLQSFEQWLESALVAISPTAEIILFSNQSPEKLVFMAKLRQDPVNEYSTRTLDISLDYDEQVTSLLCLPIMSTQRTSLGIVDWTALVVGLSSGYVKFYTEQSVCLLSLKFCDEPIISLKLQTQKINTNARSQAHFASIVDELFITQRSCAIVVDGIGLYENLRISKEDVVKSRSNYEPAYTISNLPTILTCQKWKFDVDLRDSKVLDADLLGMRCATRFDALKSNSINYDHVPSKAFTRTLVLVGRDPFLTCYREAKETASHSYTEMIGSLLPFWGKPPPSRIQINEISCSSSLSLFDRGRLATSIVPSPDKRLAAMTDDFGRVMLIDVTNWLVIRMWKGYRKAQCGWVEVKRDPEEAGSPCASFLVVYAPKRGLLEVWSTQRGPRVAAFNVGKNCRLLYAGHRMLNMRAEQARTPGRRLLTEQSYSNNCYLLNAKSETLFAIELPYTYSLYKYGDLKSRDRLLLGELSGAIQREAEVNSLSEIVQRMALAESLQTSIHKLAVSLSPDKLVPIMENLIIKIMKEYDNHAGETMSNDDQSIVELCKRLIRLCAMFNELSQSGLSNDLSLPEVNQRLIEQYEEHPKEVDEFAEQLGWEASEVLRYLSLLALERSFRGQMTQSPWPNTGEPLTWAEFVSCFDLERINFRPSKRKARSSSSSTSATGQQVQSSDKINIRLKELSGKFLTDDRVVKSAVFMYNRLSERFYRLSANSPELTLCELKEFNKTYSYLEPTSRLALLFQFWLSTKLCNHWKMWAFLQQQVGMISDELRVAAMDTDDNELLIESWKRIYQLILESDNIYAAIIATAVIRSDTLRMISDNEKREKLEREVGQDERDEAECGGHQDTTTGERGSQVVDWECLCVDAERMSIFGQQLEDVFLLGLLLRYSPSEAKLVDRFVYRVPRISVANILRAGPTVISELIAQWIAQTDLKPKIFTQPYGASDNDHEQQQAAADRQLAFEATRERPSRLLTLKFSTSSDSDEHTRELLHHVKTSFPHSLEADVLLLNCLWEFCNRWASGQTAAERGRHLDRAFDCLGLLSDSSLRHNAASWAYKTFFQRTFERLAILIETNSTILSPKCLRSRDTLSRRELNMGESCLEDFVAFCSKLSDFMLDTCRHRQLASEGDDQQQQQSAAQTSEEAKGLELRQRLMATDDWWSTPSMVRMFDGGSSNDNLHHHLQQHQQLGHLAADNGADAGGGNRNSLVSASLSSARLFDVDTLVELNRLATLMLVVFKLRIIKAYPLSIIGEESRQTLRLDLLQSPSAGADMKTRSGLLNELRQKFARKCIVSIVAELSEEADEFSADCEAAAAGFADCNNEASFAGNYRDGQEDIDTDDNDGKYEGSGGSGGGIVESKKRPHQVRQRRNDEHQPNKTTSGGETRQVAATGLTTSAASAAATRDHQQLQLSIDTVQTETNESMAMFTHLLSLACEWQIDSDELHLELVFELYRCNHDKLAAQVANRARDKQTLANGLLKIASQRVLLLFGLSPALSSADQWRKRVDKWSLFQPNVASWLKSVQEEEARAEIARLGFAETLRQQGDPKSTASSERQDASRGRTSKKGATVAEDHDDSLVINGDEDDDFEYHLEQSLGLRAPILSALCERTKLVLETVTNYLDGQANRLAYDLLQLLESNALAAFQANERRLWLKQRDKLTAERQSVGDK